MRSMTGFGQAAGENARFRMSVTLRGVNHRFLDIVLRAPEVLRDLEPALRELLAVELRRGRVEVLFNLEAVGARQVSVGVDRELVTSLRGLCDELAEGGLISPKLDFGDLLRLPAALQLEVRDPEWQPDDSELLLGLVGEALAQLVAARCTEGAKLRRVIEERLEALRQLVEGLAARRAGIAEELATQLRQRIAELLAGDLPDDSRLMQEVALLVDRSDVAEELDRLESHFEHMGSVLEEAGSIGKRLDFLAQEILRELNTVGSKCRDSEMIQQVVEGKTLCEQVREQVQNVE